MRTHATGDKYSVLVVEDSATVRQMITMSMQERGYQVIAAPDGITGLHALAEHTPDAILLDLNLPDIDGFEVCKRMKLEPRSRNIPILVMTGLGEPGFEIMAIEAGADDFIAKPIDPLVLDARIQMVIRRMRRERFTSPVTDLPAGALIDERVAFQLEKSDPFAVVMVDIDGFRPFNERYGFSRGNLVLRHVATLILESVRFADCVEPFIGHRREDDFVILCEPEKAEQVARNVAEAFDASIMDYFGDEDRDRGYFTLTNRADEEVRYGPLTLSVAVVAMTNVFPESPITLADVGSDLLGYARSQPGSCVAVERRASFGKQ